MDLLKKNWFLVAFVALVIFWISNSNESQAGAVTNPFKNLITAHDPLTPALVVCRFDVVADFHQNADTDGISDEEIEYEVVKQKEPAVLTFANLSTDHPVMKGNAGEVPLILVENNQDTILLAEKNAVGDAFFYTIFKKKKIAVWQKAYLLINHPFALVSMGYCN